MKDPIPFIVSFVRVWYTNSCVRACNACYISETTRHFSTRVREHFVTDGTSRIFKHLQNFQDCRTLSSHDCFSIVDHASTSLQLKIKDSQLHIQWMEAALFKSASESH